MTFPLTPSPSYYRAFDWNNARNGVFYQGDVVTFVSERVGMATGRRTANFETGVLGQPVTTNDAGSSSDLDIVSGTVVYDDAHSYENLAAKVTGASTFGWSVGEVVTEEHLGFSFWADSFPIAQAGMWRSEHCGGLKVLTNGKFLLHDRFATTTTSTMTLPLGQFVRLEMHNLYEDTGSGYLELKIFIGDSISAEETVLFEGLRTGTHTEEERFGPIVDWGSPIWFDNIVAVAPSYPGPYVPYPSFGDNLMYEVRNYFGEVVSTGEVSGASFEADEPVGGWDLGWYRVYLTGPNTDSVFGPSYGATNFCVIRDNSNFVAMPSAGTSGGSDGAQDFVMKGVMGLHTSRHSISDATSLGSQVANVAADAVISETYSPHNADAERPRTQWCDFPNGGHTIPQQAGVTTAVAALYSTSGVTRFEGPQNEGTPSATVATRMQAFQSAVHAGNASAKAIGPCAVDILDLFGYRAFGDAGGFDYCDEISFHAYNFATNGDLNLGRHTLDAFVAMLAEYGAETKPIWQTESTHAFTSVYGIYHPRRARVPLLEILLMEQYGIPRERNSMWYDISHGFWDYPAWLEMGDGSLNPQVVLGRVLAEETFGKPYASALDFGTPGNNLCLGSVYTNGAGESTVVLMGTSHIDGSSITLTIADASDMVTVVDGMGNESSVALTASQRITIPMTDIPAYVRLPASAVATVYAVNGFVIDDDDSIQILSTTRAIGGSAPLLLNPGQGKGIIANGGFETNYGPGVGTAFSGVTVPDTAHLLWNEPVTFNRVTIWSGKAWQASATLIDFDIQVTDNGTTWTTIKSITKETPASFLFGTDATNTGCSRETYWDEQWVFDIHVDVRTALGVRLNVRDASYGGEPDAACVATGGQGWGDKRLVLQEFGVYRSQRHRYLIKATA